MADLPKQIKRLIELIEKDTKETVDTVKSFAKMRLGQLFLMVYDPKWKHELPFYDVLPMYVLLAKKGDRMLGLNLHYLPYIVRVNVARELMKHSSWGKRIQYKDVKAAFEASKAPIGMLYLCIRTYLYSHIRSEIKEFHSQNFESIIQEVMPKFKKEDEETIYRLLMSRFYKKAKGIRGVKWTTKKKSK